MSNWLPTSLHTIFMYQRRNKLNYIPSFVNKCTQKTIVEENHSHSVVSSFGFQCGKFSDAINWEEYIVLPNDRKLMENQLNSFLNSLNTWWFRMWLDFELRK